MVQVSKTFRIFVSSTFTDLKEERNALQKRVFPKLRDLCMQHGCRFQAIDLRWGVREEASLDQQTMKICFEEIQRCQKVTPRPNFIVLLGDRYGWRPLPFEILAQEFEEIEQRVSNADKDLLREWYRRDDNAVPPVYCLQPRTGELIDHKKWKVVEGRLCSILLKGISGMRLTDDERVKYIASATEQEIIHGLRVPDAGEHVFCFFRTIKGLPQDPSAEDFIDLDELGNRDKDANEQLNGLKDKLRRVLPGNVYEYEADWIRDGITTRYIRKLCEDVYNSLAHIIMKEIERLEEVDPLDKEIADHKAFGKDRAKFFIGRAGILQTISNYVKGVDNHPLAVFGYSGSGKSALIARAVEQVRNDHPNAEIIFRFIGATPSSSDGRALLESLCHQISRCYGADESAIPTEYRELVQEFPKRLALATKQKLLILFLDALDQLSDTDHARSLTWLAANLPQHVRLIVSSLPGECLSVLEKKLPVQNLVKLEPMLPEEGRKLLDLWLEDAGRILQAHQRDEVLGKFEQCGLPLHLKLAFEEARRWESYSEKTVIGRDISGVIRDLLARLSSDANHGKTMVSRSLGYLAAAKNGLREDELLDILSGDNEVFQDFKSRTRHEPPEDRLPVVVWSRLYLDLEPYLTEHSADGTTLMTFYHPQLAKVVAEEFLAGESKKKRHEGLARYFSHLPLYIEKEEKKTANLRKLSELPYQQTYGEQWDEIERTLCDLHFVEAKCAAGMTYDLIGDYGSALDALPEAQVEKEEELKREERIKKYVKDLISFARAETSSLEIIPSIEPWSEEKIKQDTERIINKPTRLDRIRAFSQFVNSESHSLVKFASHPGFVIQQAYNYAGFGPLAKAAENVVDETDAVLLLRVPSQRPAYNPHPALLKTLIGHSEGIYSIGTSCDGHFAVSESEDKTVRIWDVESGLCLNVMDGRRGFIYALSLEPNDTLRVMISGNILYVWDIRTGQYLPISERSQHSAVSNEPFDKGSASSFSADRRIALSGGGSIWHGKEYKDFSLRVWNVKTGRCIRSLKGHTNRINAVSLSVDGRRAISASSDRTLRFWDVERGRSLENNCKHSDSVNSVNISVDGRFAISGGGSMIPSSNYTDYNVNIWNLETSQCTRILEGHRDNVNAVSLSPSGYFAVSVSADKTARVWNTKNGKCIRTFAGQPSSTKALSLTPDGRLAVLGGGSTVGIYDIETGHCLRVMKERLSIFKRLLADISCLTMSADGYLVVTGNFQVLNILNIQEGRCLYTLQGHNGMVRTVSISADGRFAASIGGDDKVSVWDIRTGRRVRTLSGISDDLTTVGISPDGRWVALGCNDHHYLPSSSTLSVQDIKTGQYLAIVPLPSTLNSLAVTGNRIIVGDEEGNVFFFNIRGFWNNPLVVTPVRLWRCETTKFSTWDNEVTAICPWCGETFAVSDEILKTIKDIIHNASLSPDQSPCLELPDQAWEEPRLLSECPLCKKPLKFNPFIVDNKGRY